MSTLGKPKPVEKKLKPRLAIGRAQTTKDLLARLKAEAEKRKKKKQK